MSHSWAIPPGLWLPVFQAENGSVDDESIFGTGAESLADLGP